jgi:hypothetical protein
VEIIDVEFQNPLLISVLENIKEVKQVVQKSETRFEFISDDSQDIRPLISQFAIDNSNLVVNMQKREEKMEDIFQNLTRD